MSYLRIGKETRKDPQKIIDEATKFFGPGGTGLELTETTQDAVELRGGGGFVRVQVKSSENGGKNEVEILTQDWEYAVKKFLGTL
jgi:hypothetical protein